MINQTISVLDAKAMLLLFGVQDQHLKRVRDALGVDISARDGQIQIHGGESAVARATEVMEQLKQIVHRQGSLDPDDVEQVLASVVNGAASAPAIDVLAANRKIAPRTPGQQRYVTAIREHDLVFCAGPAGTGKTYLAVAMAVQSLKQKRVRKIVLVRPAVEAGESLGFLPGDLEAKINPYLRPLKDALREMIDTELIKRYTEEEVIEVIPLAYMRGRTLNEAFIILDEAQNTTVSQMKMFLTRMGRGSKMVVSGDITQVDLPAHNRSGLIDALERLRRIEGVAQVRLSGADIVRHPLVQEIVRAYEPNTRQRR